MWNIFSVCFIVYLCSGIVNANGGVKILGGVTQLNTGREKNRWGSTQTGGGIEVWDTFRGHCWDHAIHREVNCVMQLFVDTRDDSNVEHYEIVASEFLVMKADSSAIDRVKFPYTSDLSYEVGEKGEKIRVFECFTWSEGYNDWGYAFLFFFVEKTTKPSFLVAFSMVPRNAGSEKFTQPEEVFGDKGRDSEEHKIGVSRCSTVAWGGLSVCYFYLWTAATTLVSYTPRYEDKEIISSGEITQIKVYVLENRGGGATHNGFPAVAKSETMSVSSSARFSSTFDFDYSLSTKVGFNVGAASADVTSTVSFGFSTTQEMEESTTTTVTTEIQWPSACEPGFRCTYQVVEKSDKQKIPVDFVFERDGSRWTETMDLIADTDYIQNVSDDCCLYNYASNYCGTERLPMCD